MRVMLFMDWPLGIDYLEPLFKYLSGKHPDWDIFFSTHDVHSEKLLNSRGFKMKSPGSNHDWAICCDSLSACPKKNRICVFHGLASKAQDFCSNRKGKCDFGYYVSASNYFTNRLTKLQGIARSRIIDGGLLKFDQIDSKDLSNISTGVLYAPTHNAKLSSIGKLGNNIYQVPDVKVKLHLYTRDGTQKGHKERRSHYDKIESTDDITSLMLNSNVVIADLGSTVIEALALGKTVIQVKPDNYKDFYEGKVGAGEISTFPEIDLPNRFALKANSIEEVLTQIGKTTPKPNFEIIENIGDMKVSKIVDNFIVNMVL